MFKRQFKASDVEKYAPSTLCINRVWLSEEPPYGGIYSDNYARLEIDWVVAENAEAMNHASDRYWIETHFRTHAEQFSNGTTHCSPDYWRVDFDGHPEALVKLAGIMPYLPSPDDDDAAGWQIAPTPHSSYEALAMSTLEAYDEVTTNRRTIRKALERWAMLVERQNARRVLEWAKEEAERAANQS